METAEHMERFRTYLTAQGLKFTNQRHAIAVAFFQAGEHVSLTELLELSRREQPSIGYATVYRTMKLMAESGIAATHHFVEGAESRFELSVDGEHHDHLICVGCSRIIEFEEPEIERLQAAIAKTYGFSVTSHRHEIYGRCEACTAALADGPAAP